MIRTIFRILKWVVSILAIFILLTNIWVVGSTSNQVFTLEAVATAPKTLLVLGTSHKTMSGDENMFFKERIKMAAKLYKSGIASRIVLSGDHGGKYYNEPLVMRQQLVALGVPDTILVADDGGVRTLDSVVRCKQLFNVDSVTIVTQKFHAYRALFISNYYQLPAVVVITDPVLSSNKYWVMFREVLARPLAVLDLYVFHRKPQFDKAIIN